MTASYKVTSINDPYGVSGVSNQGTYANGINDSRLIQPSRIARLRTEIADGLRSSSKGFVE
jgi:hypothetical protein